MRRLNRGVNDFDFGGGGLGEVFELLGVFFVEGSGDADFGEGFDGVEGFEAVAGHFGPGDVDDLEGGQVDEVFQIVIVKGRVANPEYFHAGETFEIS